MAHFTLGRSERDEGVLVEVEKVYRGTVSLHLPFPLSRSFPPTGCLQVTIDAEWSGLTLLEALAFLPRPPPVRLWWHAMQRAVNKRKVPPP